MTFYDFSMFSYGYYNLLFTCLLYFAVQIQYSLASLISRYMLLIYFTVLQINILWWIEPVVPTTLNYKLNLARVSVLHYHLLISCSLNAP